MDYGPYDQYLMEWEEQIKNDPGFPLHILYYEDLKDVSAYPAQQSHNLIGTVVPTKSDSDAIFC